MRRLLILALVMATLALPSAAQTSFFTDRALQQVNVLTSPTPLTAAIPYGPVRVCSLPLTQQSPCLPLATITDVNGNAISNAIGANFGQLTTDATGRFTFGCTLGNNYQVQVTQSSSNTPAVNYPITCPGVGANPQFNGLNVSGTFAQTGPQTKQGGSCTVAAIQALLASAAGGEIDARACTTISTNITNATGSITIPTNTTLRLGPSLWTCTITTASTPCFNLAAHGAKLLMAGQGDTTSNSSSAGQTILQCSACGTTTDMIDIGAGTGIFRSVEVKGGKILMASSGRYGIYVIGGWHEGVIEDIAIYEAPNDDLHIEGGTGADYRSSIRRLLTEKGGGYGGRIQGSSTIVGEVAFLTFEDDEFDSAAITTMLGGFRIDMPAGSIATAQLHNISFINCHFQPGDPGTHTMHSFDLTQAGSGQILNIGIINSAFEVNPGNVAGALGISVSSVSATGIQGVQCLGCAFANVNAIHNIVNGSNVTDSFINVGPPAGTDYQISRLIISGALSSTGQNSIEFNQSGQARTILYAAADGHIVARRQDTSQDIVAISSASPVDATSGVWPTADNTFQLGRSNFRWINGWFSSATRAALHISDQGPICTNAELSLSAGWQSTGTATVTAVAGNGQTCSWTITTGTTTAANPTVTDTLTTALPAATTVCWMNIYGGTHTAVAGESLRQTTLSATAPVFTANFTPTAGGTTYFVTRGCGP